MQTQYDLAGLIIGCAIEVHRHLGPGLLEAPYERCLAREMTLQGIPFRRQESLSIRYKSEIVESAFIPDFIVDNRVIVEVKAVAKLADIHKQQLMTYLKLSGCEVGLLINFNVMTLTHGVKRVVYRCP
jgi:GxxExxY protein